MGGKSRWEIQSDQIKKSGTASMTFKLAEHEGQATSRDYVSRV